MNKNYLILSLAIILVGAAFLTGQFMVSSSISGTASGTGIIHGGISCFQIIRMDGAVEDLGCEHNQFMSEGSEFLADEMATSGSGNAIDQILLGNTTDTTNAGLTDHPGLVVGCGLDAIGGINWLDVDGTGNISANHTWTSTCTIVVNTTGLNCSACAAATNYFAGNNFTTAATLASGDQLNVTWFVWAA